MGCKPYRPIAVEGIREDDDPCLAIENENSVGLLHPQFWIQRKCYDDVGIEKSVVDETAPEDATALRWNGTIQILAVGHHATVIEAHGVGQRAVQTIKSHIDVADHRRSIYRDIQCSHGRSELAVLRHQVKNGASPCLWTSAYRYAHGVLAAHRCDDVADILRKQRAIRKECRGTRGRWSIEQVEDSVSNLACRVRFSFDEGAVDRFDPRRWDGSGTETR